MINFQKQHYYDLQGVPAQLESVLLAGPIKAHELRFNQGDNLFIRITKFVAGIFLGLLCLPLMAMGNLIKIICREKIDKADFKREFDIWNQIFYHSDNEGNIHYDTLRLGSPDLIEQLIRSKQKASDCPFQHILTHLCSTKLSVNLFEPDGEAFGFRSYIDEEKSCLVILFPVEGYSVPFKKRYAEITRIIPLCPKASRLIIKTCMQATKNRFRP